MVAIEISTSVAQAGVDDPKYSVIAVWTKYIIRKILNTAVQCKICPMKKADLYYM